ncbi:endo-polygalacturonase [Trifolium repens]|nr:Pectin lyase superfamily protein [Trifolium repens]WJX75917.1 endo-polygalacturonase [Trifolium repens]
MNCIIGTKYILVISCILYITIISSSNAAPSTTYNVIKFGAKPDGKTDSTESFLNAWKSACGSLVPSTIYVPKGRYLLNAINFRGPCKSKVTFLNGGTLVASEDYKVIGNSGFWILFNHVDNLVVSGGKLDAKGAGFWDCRRSGKNCPVGARTMTFNWVNNLVVSGITSINSQLSHLVINTCNNVIVRNVRLIAPDKSPNTDGIHVQYSNGVTINGCTMQTGDDCISIGDATYNLFMSNIKCGPGHGVSIGSLGQKMDEKGVENVTLTNAIFYGSDNGVRIKSWARPSNGYVRNVLFQNIVMNNVENPIIIDQNYCPNNQGCPGQTSGIKISQVTYKNIHGSSATKEAVTFDCSPSTPCQGIKLEDINLNYKTKAATSSCKNIGGTSIGTLVPESCLLN